MDFRRERPKPTTGITDLPTLTLAMLALSQGRENLAFNITKCCDPTELWATQINVQALLGSLSIPGVVSTHTVCPRAPLSKYKVTRWL